MARTLASTIVAEATSSSLRPVTFVDLEFDGGAIWLWNGIGSITVASTTYSGVGSFLSVSSITEIEAVKSTGVNISLNGIQSNILANAFNEDYQDRPVTIYLGFMDSDNAFIDRVQLFKGRLDVMTIHESGGVASITVSAENILVGLERVRHRRFTHEDQQKQFPNDSGFQYVVSLQQKELTWGQS